MAKSNKKAQKKRKDAQMEAKFFRYAILGTVILLVLYLIFSNIGN